eukprot:TRINITY_DN6458_c0_g1_i2.p3 TRINITY_DN6458_c0_g1~~TRINITY_DN6458_c0_g1_i2.p3  ORF type:complete len:117 (-),score=7.92 TRINITY_DN6458_c0_g1_i2:140-490(-)
MIDIKCSLDHDLAVRQNKRLCIYYKTGLCAPCQIFTPKYQRFPNYFGNIQFGICDLDEMQGEINSIHSPITIIPTLILYRNGKEINRLEGLPQQRPARKLSLALRYYLLDEQIQKQ